MGTTRERDGQSWTIGTAADVAWIEDAVDFSTSVETEVPPGYAAYCRLDLPGGDAAEQAAHDAAVIDVLSAGSTPGASWWLGFHEHGVGIDLPFDDAPRTVLFGWTYVVVRAGPAQALRWRAGSYPDLAWKGALPELIFPEDRAWLLFTSWDDHWSGIGGPSELIDAFKTDAVLGPRIRTLDQPRRLPHA